MGSYAGTLPDSTGLPSCCQVPTPPRATWTTRSKPSRWRTEAARPLRAPALQIVAIGRSRGSSTRRSGRSPKGMWSESGMWPPSNSAGRRTSRTSGGSSPARRSASCSGPIASIRSTGRSSARQARHAAAEEAAHPQPHRGQQLGSRQLVAVGGGDDDQLAVGRNDLGDLGGEAGVVGGGADRAGDVRLVELLVGARVHCQRTCGDRRLEAARRQPGRRARSSRSEARG